ncbi:TPA: hypothetical protein N0F65_007176 [Lagenidium giganteum]|uniref:Secreted protein n=1 Tax=Lagenidium giganteum TaxID=4803 RepID=A0AAV2Z9Q0_9STRA|nr:TPA: hypothetical protein N0F65_007176 [Lagenidium giganteum]
MSWCLSPVLFIRHRLLGSYRGCTSIIIISWYPRSRSCSLQRQNMARVEKGVHNQCDKARHTAQECNRKR